MRILFCDDNKMILEQLRSYVSDYFKENGGQQPELVCYDNGDALLAAETRADIAFLDVEMPGINGIQLGARLKEMNPHIKIFIVTSYPDYLDEAMRSNLKQVRILPKAGDISLQIFHCKCKKCLLKKFSQCFYQKKLIMFMK